jgi:hypothetical protein
MRYTHVINGAELGRGDGEIINSSDLQMFLSGLKKF